jgi:molecular chaperone HtpG
MADLDLNSLAEKRAKQAETLACFGSLNLAHIKRQVSELLRLIGTNGIFDEYTKHDISHINSMLELVTQTVIPLKTQSLMTPADWLMIVLSVYFHDLGMLVTRREYLRRNESGFPEFRRHLLDGPQGQDYEKRLSVFPTEDEKERFIYQEFVRNHHAKRIRDWVTGAAASELGVANEAAGAVSNILEPLGEVFRRDLGLVAESHHADDLHDFRKYKPSQPYGTQQASTANLQYAALVLRAADLLHMTCDRTPSIMFKTINPSDPLSQREWAKQMAVRSVRAQPAKDSEGKVDENLPQDTLAWISQT